MKHKILLLNLIITISIYGQNIDYNKYESSKNEDLSYKVYLDNQNSKNIEPFLKEEDYDNRRIVADYKTDTGKYSYADKGIGIFVNKKKTGEWNYYFNGILKEKSNYFEGLRQGATFLYKDNGEVSDTLYYYSDFVDGMLNLKKMSNYIEYVRSEETYSKFSSKFSNGEWIEKCNSENEYVGKKNGNNRRTGVWKVYETYENEKKVVEIINYENGVRNGKSISYNFFGNIDGIVNFENGVLSGEVVSFYSNGKVRSIENYKNNLKIGKTIVITKNGDGEVYYYEGVSKNGIKVTDSAILKKIKNFNNPNIPEEVKSTNKEDTNKITPTNKTKDKVESITTLKKTTESEDNTVYNSMGVSKYPEFIGGIDKMNLFVNENYINKLNLGGKIFVSFIIEKNGNLSNIKVLRDIGVGSADEIIRVLNLCKNCWSPAEIEGKKVRCQYSLPITINK